MRPGPLHEVRWVLGHSEHLVDGQQVAEHPQLGAERGEPWVRSDEAAQQGEVLSEAQPKRVVAGVKREPWIPLELAAEVERKEAESGPWRGEQSAA